jgi:benzoate membrane transport protein
MPAIVAGFVAVMTGYTSSLALMFQAGRAAHLANAMQDVRQREAALVTFMVTASGLTLLSIGSAFWGLVAGIVTNVILNWRGFVPRKNRTSHAAADARH